MNKLILSLLLICSSFYGNTQVYERLADSNKLWSVFHDLSMEGSASASLYVHIKGDTLINAKMYGKVYFSADSAMGIWTFKGYLRDDSIGQKVYLMDSFLNEGIIYDFSKGINDTGHIYNPFYSLPIYPVNYTVVKTDSVLINSEFKKRLVLDLGVWGNDTIIMGIGSTSGIVQIGNNLMGGGKFSLICYEREGLLLYHNALFSKCFYTPSSIIDNQNGIEIEVSPTVVRDYLSIKINSVANSHCSFVIINMNGAKVYTGELYTQNYLDLTSLTIGIYILKLNTDNLITNYKFIKL